MKTSNSEKSDTLISKSRNVGSWKSSIIVGVVALLIFSVFAYSFAHYGGKVRTYDLDEGAVSKSMSYSDASFTDCCYTPEQGMQVTGGNPTAEFKLPEGSKSIKLLFNDQIFKDTPKRISFKQNNQIVEIELKNHMSYLTDNYLCYDFDKYQIESCIVALDSQPEISTITTSFAQLAPVDTSIPTNMKFLIAGLVCAIVAGLLTMLLQRKTNFIVQFLRFVKCNWKIPILAFISCLISVAIGCLLELLVSSVIGKYFVSGCIFNIFRALTFAAFIELVFIFVYQIKKRNFKVENLFLAVVLCLGFAFIFCTPFEHICWDTESHYKWDVGMANASTVMTESDRQVVQVGDYDKFSLDHSLQKEYENIYYLNNHNDTAVSRVPFHFELAHVPGAMVVSVSRLLGLPFYWQLQLIKIVNLLIYALTCYFGIRCLKSRKVLFSILALMPTCVFLATSFSYDSWIFGFTMLGGSLFISEFQKANERVNLFYVVLMCSSLFLACLPKPIYAAMLILPFFLWKKGFHTNKQKKYFLCIVIGFIVLLGLILLLKSRTEIMAGGDMRGGRGVSTIGQIMFILHNPLDYFNIFTKFALDYLSVGGSYGFSTFLAYLGYGYFGVIIGSVYLVLLIVVCILDVNKSTKHANSILLKVFTIAIFIISVVLIITALYVSFNPVGSNHIEGCQPRYLLPLLVMFLGIMWPSKFLSHYNGKNFSLFVVAIASGMTYFQLVTATLPFLN